MKINRRQFLKGSAGSVAALGIANQAGAMELALGNESYNYIKREPRERVFTSLLGNEPRKTGWMRAEAAGDGGPWRQQVIKSSW